MKNFGIVSIAALALLLAAPTAGFAQEPTPLDREDLERLITGDTYTQDEVAGIVRRSCLAFSPGEDDLERFRGLGASEAVVEAIRGCAEPAAPAGAAPEVLDLDVEEDSLLTSVGSAATLRVDVGEEGRPRAGVPLVLEGSERLPGVDDRLEARTDSLGTATFRLPVGNRPASYSFRLLARGFWLRGSNRVHLRVIAADPASVTVRPERIELAPGREEPLAITVFVADRFGNPVSEAIVRVRAAGPDAPPGPWRGSTGSDGTATIRIPPDELAEVEELAALAGDAAGRIAVSTRAEIADEEAEVAARDTVPAGETGEDAAVDTVPAPERPEQPERRDEPPQPVPAGIEDESTVGAAALLELSAWGGETFDNGRPFGFRAGRIAVSPTRDVRIWGRFDHTLVLVRPYMKRGEVDFISYFGGLEVDWGAGDRFSTWIEAGRRQHAVTDEWQTLGHLRQSVRFGEADAPAFQRPSLTVGGFVGDWFDRTSWGVEAGFGVPASPSFRLEGLGSFAETVAMRADPTLVSARDVRFELTGRVRVAGWEVAPTGVVGSVSDSDLGEAREGALYEGRFYVESAPIGGVARVLGTFRIQDHPESDDFSQAAVGIRIDAPR